MVFARPAVADRRALDRANTTRRSLHHAANPTTRAHYTICPIAGVVWHAVDNLNVYFSYGQGFETPTFAELAYNPVGPGLNFGLDPATRPPRAGLKRSWPNQRPNRRFQRQTKQVPGTPRCGRTTDANAGRTRARASKRNGMPILIRHHRARELARGLAEFADAHTSGTPPAVVPAAGSRSRTCRRCLGLVDAWRLSRLQRQCRGAVRWQDLRERSQHRRGTACTIGNLQAGFAQTRGASNSRNTCGQQRNQREVRRLRHRRRYERALLRAGAGSQLVRRSEHRRYALISVRAPPRSNASPPTPRRPRPPHSDFGVWAESRSADNARRHDDRAAGRFRTARALDYCRFGLSGWWSIELGTPSPSRSPLFQCPCSSCHRSPCFVQVGSL